MGTVARHLAAVAVILTILQYVKAEKQTGLTLVGVLLQPMAKGMELQYPGAKDNFQYIKGFFVDYIESAGASAVLIPFDLPLDTLNLVLDSLQAVMLPGGAADLVDKNGEPTAYQLRQHYILEYAKKRFLANKPLPVMGICLGFEAMLISAAGNNCSVLQGGFNDNLTAHSLSIDQSELEKTKIWSSFD